MSQTQFLLLLLAIIPLGNCLIIMLCDNLKSLSNISSKLAPILFLAVLLGLHNSGNYQDTSLVFAQFSQKITFAFALDENALKFLFLLDFLWLGLVFYSRRFLKISHLLNINESQIFFALIFTFLALIFASRNLFTILFFYNALLLLCHFFAVRFLYKPTNKFSQIFTFLLYLESVFLFLAIIATYKFTNNIDYISYNSVNLEPITSKQSLLLLALYVFGLFFSILIPSYLFFAKLEIDLLFTYVLFFLAYALSSIYIFTKLIITVFGFTLFSSIISKMGFSIIEIFFLINIMIAGVFLASSKDLKSSFFYLFFQQFLLVLFEIFLLGVFQKGRIYLSVISFSLSISLLFFCLSNFSLYLQKAENKSLDGLFTELKITSILFLLAISNMIGISPAIALVKNFFIMKVIFTKGLTVSMVIFGLNSLSLIIFAIKILYPLVFGRVEKRSQADEALARDIDYDSSLMLIPLLFGIAMIMALIFFKFL